MDQRMIEDRKTASWRKMRQIGWIVLAYFAPFVGLTIVAPAVVMVLKRRDVLVRSAAGEAMKLQIISIVLAIFALLTVISLTSPVGPGWVQDLPYVVPVVVALGALLYSGWACVRSVRRVVHSETR